MTCRCPSSHEHAKRASQRDAQDAQHARAKHEEEVSQLKSQLAALTPDNSRYEVLEARAVGDHLVMKVIYIGCQCEYDGEKILVFVNVTPIDALKWTKIDPHFQNPGDSDDPSVAPGPSARFPASVDGWQDALKYAEQKWGE